MVDEIRVSQAATQVLVTEPMPEVRISQAPAQVLVTEPTPEVRVSQAPAQVLVSEPNPEVRISQAPVQILASYTAGAHICTQVNTGYGSMWILDMTPVLDGVLLSESTKIRYDDSVSPPSSSQYYVYSFWYNIASTALKVLDSTHPKSYPILGTFRIDHRFVYNTVQADFFLEGLAECDTWYTEVFADVWGSPPSNIPGFDDTWHHFIISENTTTGRQQLYIDGLSHDATWDDLSAGTPFKVGIEGGIGNDWFGGREGFNGYMDQIYFAYEDIDLSVPANLAKFVTGTGASATPVYLGANGEAPTGSIPYICLNEDGEDFINNNGSMVGSLWTEGFLGTDPNVYYHSFNYSCGYSYDSPDGTDILNWDRIDTTATHTNNYITTSSNSVSPYHYYQLFNEIKSTSSYSAFTATDVGNVLDPEILIDVQIDLTGPYDNAIVLRADSVGNAEKLYGAGINASGNGVIFYRNGTGSATTINTSTKGFLQDDWIKCRFYVSAANLMYVKWWPIADSEPGAWDHTALDLSALGVPILPAGHVGISNYTVSNTTGTRTDPGVRGYFYDKIAVNTGGSTAVQP